MFEILHKETFAAETYLMEVVAPRIAHSALPGQFLIVKMEENSERIPLTISDYHRVRGTVTIVFKAIGESTIAESGEDVVLREGEMIVEGYWIGRTVLTVGEVERRTK